MEWPAETVPMGRTEHPGVLGVLEEQLGPGATEVPAVWEAREAESV